MSAELLAPLSALWLGVLVSVSPCPLATNVAAVSYLGRHLADPRRAFLSALLYAAGRAAAYALLGGILAAGLLAAPGISFFLQTETNKLLGPMLLLGGVFLLDVLPISFSLPGFGADVGERARRLGLSGALLLGALFALSFCPVSAALFFGSLLPLTLKSGMTLLLPVLFGVGSALPAAAFAILVAFAGNRLSRAFSRTAAAELWARRVTGALFLLLGGYFTLDAWFGFFA